MSFKSSSKGSVRFSSQQPTVLSFVPKRRSNITTTGMIKKWKVSPVSTRTKTSSDDRQQKEIQVQSKSGYLQKGSNGVRVRAQSDNHQPTIHTTAIIKSKDDSTPQSNKASARPRKPRRHTTGGSKQTAEDIRRAKELAAAMNGDTIVNEIDQEIDPNSTLGRKQLIAMLKQRYGPEIEQFRTTEQISEKERARRERQRERDMRHEKRTTQDNRELYHHNGVHHSPAITSKRDIHYKTGIQSRSESDCSEDLSYPSSPSVSRAVITNSATTTRQTSRRSNSDDEVGRNDPRYLLDQQPAMKQSQKDVVFLQLRDEVKRVNLPASVNSLETIKALFVNSFPGKLATSHFDEGFKSIYIKDMDTGVYYQLEDISEVVNRSFLKIQEHDIISDSRSEASAYAYRTQTLPTKGRDKEYAESLQDYQLTAPRIRRDTSGSSVKSDNGVTRPTHRIDPVPDMVVEGNRMGVVNTDDTYTQVKHIPPKKIDYVPAQSMTVQDQLEDLSELLRTALSEEDKHHAAVLQECVDIKNPGKINQNLIDNLQHTTENIARKSSHPKYFQPTAIIMAQQESDRNTLTSDNNPPGSAKTINARSAVKVTVNGRKQEPKYIETRPAINNTLQTNGPHVTEGFISPAKRQHYLEYSNTMPKEKNADIKSVGVTTKTASLSANTPRNTPANTPRNINETVELKNNQSDIPEGYSEQIAHDLLSQLVDLEEEVKAQSTRTSSRGSSLQSSRRNSNTSTESKSSITVTNSMKHNMNEPIEEDMHRTRVASMPAHHHQPIPTTHQNTRATSLSSDDASPVYATVNKVVREVPTHSHTVTTFNASMDSTDGDVFVDTARSSTPSRKQTGDTWKPPSVTTPDFFELESTARIVQNKLKVLKTDLQSLRKFQADNARNFKADLQKKLLEFRKKAARVDEHLQQKLDLNNNFIFAKEHPVRERRHRLTTDQLQYGNKMTDTESRLQSLEGSMEMIRIDVVNKKRVDDPELLENMHDELTTVTKGLAEIKNRYHGLHDMLKVVMAAESDIIKNEEIFLKEEPDKLEKLIVRCKALSETLFTLQKLASVQGVSQVSPTQQKSFNFNTEKSHDLKDSHNHNINNNNNAHDTVHNKSYLGYGGETIQVRESSLRYPNVKHHR